ncbi:Predicted branched-chain amino acid permease (azaleucine resistance) [Geodermatophilus pulveris]|uniref:Predicted branched-chain amino acid permease (Azaleucine resistance) n=1 Tax=Geodermatophilus pulveris TaxID=1564159 RepID=A0A239CDE5_9ACTN|nr:AzlC family ABC transporter permease [Geodermatophilus pulveris]SNS17383.1 Predicted branched-chain amino acid permease (azaleucine resistance) [Geodermatophilus pulveris]
MAGSTGADRGWREGVRDGTPYAAATFVLAVSFGVVAVDLGVPAVAAVVMSAVVYSGSAQFAAVGIAAAGGGLAAAVGAAALVSSRFLPMGFALGPSLHGSRLRRAVEGQATVDSAWAMAARGDGRFDRRYLFGHSGTQYGAWVLGTAVGVFVPGLDSRALGLDAVFPVFFLAILVAEVRDRLRFGVALAGAAIALALVPVSPPGLPVLAATAAALAGLRAGR